MLSFSAISESSISESDLVVLIYTNEYTFIVYIKKEENLDFKIKEIEEIYGKIRKIEYVV